jgi:hypothetical protein
LLALENLRDVRELRPVLQRSDRVHAGPHRH